MEFLLGQEDQYLFPYINQSEYIFVVHKEFGSSENLLNLKHLPHLQHKRENVWRRSQPQELDSFGSNMCIFLEIKKKKLLASLVQMANEDLFAVAVTVKHIMVQSCDWDE